MQLHETSVEDSMAEMIAEIEAAPAVFRPSQFWENLNEINLRMLSESGLPNFKRTLAQNYFNWLVTNRNDPQFQTLLQFWRRRPLPQPLLNRMVDPKDIRTTLSDENFTSKSDLFVYKIFVGLLWEYMRRHDRTGLGRRLEEPLEGNPILIKRWGRRISQDLANSILELNLIREHFSRDLATARIAELGAGYGRLAHVFHEYSDATHYYIIDIPPALVVSQYYLSKLVPERKIFRFRRFDRFEQVRAELDECRIAFLTPTQLDQFPDGYFDLCLSISTLPEMTREQAEHFVALLTRKSNHMLFLKQWIEWKNTFDDVCLARDDYQIAPDWKLIYNEVDRIQPAFFNAFWEHQS